MSEQASLFPYIIYHAPKCIHFMVGSKDWRTTNVEKKRDENRFEGIKNQIFRLCG
jgi:hypothetical protein